MGGQLGTSRTTLPTPSTTCTGARPRRGMACPATRRRPSRDIASRDLAEVPAGMPAGIWLESQGCLPRPADASRSPEIPRDDPRSDQAR